MERAVWIFLGVGSALFATIAGYYGWSTILFWSLLAWPLAARRRQEPPTPRGRWLAGHVSIAWVGALALSLVSGLLAGLDSSVLLGGGVASYVLQMSWFVTSWAGGVLSIYVIIVVTHKAVTPTQNDS